MEKNILENLPSELLDKLIEYVNNKTSLSMTSKKLRKYFNKKNKVFFDKLKQLWIQENKESMSNIMTNFQFQKSEDCFELSKKQSDVRKSFSSQLEDIRQSEVIQQLLSDKILDDKRDVIKKLLDKQNEDTKLLHFKQVLYQRLFDIKQDQILLEFNTKQCEAFAKFNMEESQSEAIEIFLRKQTDNIEKLHFIQNNGNIKLQSEQTTTLWKLQLKQNDDLLSLPNTTYDQKIAIQKLSDAIKDIQSIQDNNIRKLHFEQINATRKLQIDQLKKTHEYNFKYVKYSKLMEASEVEACFKYMIEDIKTIIYNEQKYKYIYVQRLNFLERSMCEICEKELNDNEYNRYIDDEYNQNIDYSYVYIIKIIIFLYLIKEFHFKLIFDNINYRGDRYLFEDTTNGWLIEDRFFDYFKIVFPTLNNITTIDISKEFSKNLLLSLKLFELLLLLPKLQNLTLKIIPTILDFELPDQKLQINNLEILIDKHNDDKYYNIHKIVEMCPHINELNLFDDGMNSEIDNKYLVKLGEILNKYELISLRINTAQHYNEEELDFIPILSNCPNLQKFDLSGGCMKHNAAFNIAKIVSIRTNFTYLDLGYNHIHSGIEIAKILSGHISLSHLDLSHNKFEDEEKEKIREILSQNQTLKDLLL
jgi:hypothetical protein